MPEALEQEHSEQFDLQRLFGVVRRRHLQFLLPLFFGWFIVWGASWVLPPRYKSSTLILVEQPSMPQNYVVPNISDDLQVRMQSIKTQILSRTRLLLIIDRLHLYSGKMDDAQADEKVARMVNDIDVDIVRDPARQDISSFRISYSASNPRVAQQVTGELTELFINENNKVVQQESQGTTSFLEQQLEAARASLSDQEAKVHQFESMHEGALPTQQASNLQILAGLQSELQNEQDALNSSKQQRVYLQALLEQQKTALARVRPTGGDAKAGPTDLLSVDEQLDKLRAQLVDLSAHYTDQYPDVVSVKHQIAQMEALRANLAAAAKARPKTSTNGALTGEEDPTLSGPAQQTQSQLQANQLEIQNRENEIAATKARIGDYQGRLNAQPGTEQDLADLTRGYDQSKANYDDLLKKKEESEMATSMEAMQQGERFTMLDPPSLPSKPDFPNRLKFCAMGFAAGLALGLLVAGGLEFMDDRLHSEKAIKSLLPIPVISEIPEISSPGDEQAAKKKMVLGWVTTAIVFVTILIGSVFSFLHS